MDFYTYLKTIFLVSLGLIICASYYAVGKYIIEEFGYTWKAILKETFITLGIVAGIWLVILLFYFIVF